MNGELAFLGEDYMVREKLSVIIPVYNSERTLHRCLNSIVNQMDMPEEIIIVDDGSKDSSAEICSKYAKTYPQIKVLRIQNGGVSRARNMGLAAATGDLIQFIDSDDELDSEFFSKMRLLIKNRDCAICGYNRVSPSRRVVQTFTPPSIEFSAKSDWEQYFNILYRGYFLFNLWNKIFRRSIIETYNIRFNESMSLGEDLLFNLDYFRYCDQIASCADILYYYNIENSNSLTQRFLPNKPEIDRLIFSESLKFCDDMGILSRTSIYIIYFKSCFTSFEKMLLSKKLSRVQEINYINDILTAKETLLSLKADIKLSKEALLYKFLLQSGNISLIKFSAMIRAMIKGFLLR
jgi:glycosyltransferase involved in cell wall biosynthesis